VAFSGRSSLLTEVKIDGEGESPAYPASPATTAKAFGPTQRHKSQLKIKKARVSQAKVKQAKTSS